MRTKAVLAEFAQLDPVLHSHRRPLEEESTTSDHQLCAQILASPRELASSHSDRPVGYPRSHPIGYKALLSLGGLLAIAAVVVVVLAMLPSSPARVSTRHVTSSRWRLTASLSGPEFQLGTGNPNGVIGIVCGPGSTCLLSTGYSLDSEGGGGVFVSHDGGHTWTPSSLPANAAATSLASCVTTSWCAVGIGILDPATGDPAAEKPSRDPELAISTDSGTTWSALPVPIPVAVEQLPAYGNLPAETTYWPGEIDVVSCSSPGVCDLLGQGEAQGADATGDQLYFLRTTDGGVHWTTAALPSTSPYQLVESPGSSETMSCPTSLDCVVMASLEASAEVWHTTDGGAHWQRVSLSAPSAGPPDLSCPSAKVCFAGVGGSILRSNDGGATWTSISLPGPPSGVSAGQGAIAADVSVSCVSDLQCYTTAYAHLAETVNGGESWQPVSIPSDAHVVLSVTCTPSQVCAAIALPESPPIEVDNGGSLILTNSPAAAGT